MHPVRPFVLLILARVTVRDIMTAAFRLLVLMIAGSGIVACGSSTSTDSIRSDVASSVASTSPPSDVTSARAPTTCPAAIDLFGPAEAAIHDELNTQPNTGAPPQVPEAMVERLLRATRDLESQCETPNTFDFIIRPSELLKCLDLKPDPSAVVSPGYRLFPGICEVRLTMVVPGPGSPVSTGKPSEDTSAGPLTMNTSAGFEACRLTLHDLQPVAKAVENAFLSQSGDKYEGVVEVSDSYIEQLTSLTLKVQAACEDSGVIDSVRGAPASAPSDLAACLVPGVVTYSCGRSLLILNIYVGDVLR